MPTKNHKKLVPRQGSTVKSRARKLGDLKGMLFGSGKFTFWKECNNMGTAVSARVCYISNVVLLKLLSTVAHLP